MIGIPREIAREEGVDIARKLNILNGNSTSHYFQDDNYFTPLSPVYPERLFPGVNFSIIFDSRMSASVNPISEAIYLKNGSKYFVLIKLGDNRFMLKRNCDGQVIAPEGKYNFIITTDNNSHEVRVGNMPHHYLNDKRFNHVILAGEIKFKRAEGTSEIVELSDRSGSYHLKDFDHEIYKLKLASISAAVSKVGIPLDKLNLYAVPLIDGTENRPPTAAKVAKRNSIR